MSNFVNESVIGKGIVFEELTENPLVNLIILIGSVAIAGYFMIMFGKELWAILFPKVMVT